MTARKLGICYGTFLGYLHLFYADRIKDHCA